MTCKDCIHYDLCHYSSRILLTQKGISVGFAENVEENCEFFENHARFVKPPCKPGDTLYVPHGSYIMEQIVVSIEFTEINITIHAVDKLTYIPILILPESIGVLAFLTRDEAEQRLDGGRKND